MTVLLADADPAPSVRQPQPQQQPQPRAVAKRLEGLKGDIAKNRQEDFVRLVASVRNPGLKAGYSWAHVDLMTAFEPDTTISEPRDWFRSLSGYLMFLPLILTWFGLHGALSAYSQMPPGEREPSFFAQWIVGFDGWRTGVLPVPSLGELALVVALVFAIVILLGMASDMSGSKVHDRRNELRGALTDAARLFAVRFPESPSGTVAALDDLSARIADMGRNLDGISRSLIATQEEVLRTTAGAVERMGDMLSQGLAQNTEAMIRSGEAVALLASTTELDARRRTDYDRIQSHIADSALELKEAADRLQASLAGARMSDG